MTYFGPGVEVILGWNDTPSEMTLGYKQRVYQFVLNIQIIIRNPSFTRLIISFIISMDQCSPIIILRYMKDCFENLLFPALLYNKKIWKALELLARVM